MSIETPKKKLIIQEDSSSSEDKNKLFPLQPGFTRVKIDSTSGSDNESEDKNKLFPLQPGFTRVKIDSTSGSDNESEYDSQGEKDENDENELEIDFNKIKDKCDNNKYSNDCNKFMLKKELTERKSLKKEDDKPYLYPNLNDPNFNIKIAEKKEFNDTKYDGEIYKSIKEHADELANADFELSPHQAFVKNFLSSQTPYNSLLLYHGLGSGKT
jgi:hypothetical protein